MRLLVVCPHFEPDLAPTGVVMAAIVGQLREAGHQISVVTSLPWYRLHRVEPQWRGRLVRSEVPLAAAGGTTRVTRVHPFPTDKRSVAARAAGYAAFSALASAVAVSPAARPAGPGSEAEGPEGVLAMSPPITLGMVGWAAARRWRAPLVFNVQDVFPDAAIEVGAIRSPGVAAAARRIERLSYRLADAVTVLSDDIAADVKAKIDPRWNTRVRVVPNFVDADRIRPADRLTHYRAEHGLGERVVVMYAGNVGLSQPLGIMLDAARALRHREDVVFVVNGAGSALQALEAEAAGLPNVVLVGYQPQERLAEVLASADIHVVALRRRLARCSVPSKLYSILAAGRAVVASVDAGTEVARVLDSAGCGLVTPAENSRAFTAALVKLIDDPAARAEMGRRGRGFAESHMSAAAVAGAYAQLFAELARCQAPGAAR